MNKAQAIHEVYKACVEIRDNELKLVLVDDAFDQSANPRHDAVTRLAQAVGALERAACSRKEEVLQEENARLWALLEAVGNTKEARYLRTKAARDGVRTWCEDDANDAAAYMAVNDALAERETPNG